MKTIDLAQARQRLDEAAARHTTSLSYHSAGHCLIIGERARALAVARRLDDNGATVVSIDPAAISVSKALTDTGMAVFTVPGLTLDGYLGAFSAVATTPDKPVDLGVSTQRPEACFDQVLDLSETPLLSQRVTPFGYAHAPTAESLDAALAALAELVGDFDKPRYFAWNPSICAHSRSQLVGCSKCIDVCVTGAISPDGEGVAVDPYLCQGCGSCATLCPTGAMVYAYPKPSDAIERTRAELRARPTDTVLLHSDASLVAVETAKLPPSVLALEVEEVSAFGVDYWATLLCAGVGRLLLLVGGEADDPNRLAIEEQAALLRRLLEGLGIGPDVIQLIDESALDTFDTLPLPDPRLVAMTPAAFTTHDDKRATIRAALDTLAGELGSINDHADEPLDIVALEAGAPFGHLLVDTDACTLCMACVSTCPAGALLDGRDSPALRLVEASCVQCGLCEQACPESAITLEARYVRDSVAARRSRTLYEEVPFHCVNCSKPFATRGMIETMVGKLSGHWMFGDDKALRRLKMCADCRVRDIFESESGGIDVHAGAGKTSGKPPA